MKSSSLWVVLPPVLVFVLFLAAAEFGVRLLHVPRYLVPPPSQVWRTIEDDRVELWEATQSTTLASLAGFGASAAGGMLIAILLSSSRWVQRAFYPYALFFQTVPIVAIAPLLVIWIGYGTPTVVTSAFIVSIFPVIANTLGGLLSTDPALRDLFRLYGASPVATLLKLRLPMALPSIFTGLRVGAGLAVIGTIVGEFITGAGLGGLIQVSQTQQRADKVFAGLLLSGLLGLVLFTLVGVGSRLTLRNWHPSERR